jgi:hypothetical protein
MSRTLDLLNAVAARLEDLPGNERGRLFTEVKVELDRYDLGDLLTQSARAPFARVCFMKAAPVRNAPGRKDRDVSLAIVVVAGRSGRAQARVSSADAAALDLIDQIESAIDTDPYVGLGKLSAAELGDQLVAVSEETGKKGLAIALIEAKWRLLDVTSGPVPIQTVIGMTGDPRPVSVTVGAEVIAPEPAP